MTREKKILLCLVLSLLSIFTFASCGLFGGGARVIAVNAYQERYDLSTNSTMEDVRDSIVVYVDYDNGVREIATDYDIQGEIIEGYSHFEITYSGWYTSISIYFEHGHKLEMVEAVEGTCMQQGSIQYWICSDCGRKFCDPSGNEEIYYVAEYGDHVFEIIEGYAPTCTEYGLTDGKYCTECGYVEEYQYDIYPLGHTPVYGEYCTEAELCITCGSVLEGFDHTMTEGSCIEVKVCTRCPYVSDEYGVHDIVIDEAVAVTCTDFGFTAGEHCAICSQVFVAQTKIPATGHDYRVVSVTNATCTESGLKVVSCNSCGNCVTQVTNALGHNVTVYDNEVAATCEANGSRTGYCSRCYEYITVEIPALGHTAGDFIFEDEYCGNQKLGYYKCTVCDIVIQSFGHTYKTAITDPTCTQSGEKVYTCSHCAHTYSETIDAMGHTRGEWSVVTEATCSLAGSEALFCAFCDEVLQSSEIAIKAHNYESEIGEQGITYTCTMCSDSYYVEIEQTVTITFVTVLDGVVCAPLTVNKGYTATLPVLEKSGYNFNGWCLDEELKLECNDSYVFNEDETLYASWSIVTVEGSASSVSIITGAPLDFKFAVTSVVALTDQNLKNYISIQDIEGRSPSLYIASIDGGVYTIASDEYREGMSYEVVVNGVSLVGTDEKQLMFVTESENSTNVVYKDEVVFVSESDVLTVYEDVDGKIYFFLRKDLLDVDNIAIIYGEEIDDILVTMKVVAEGNADNIIEGAFVYEVEAVDADEVFAECNIYFSGEIDTDNMEFVANLEEELVDAVVASSLYAQLEHTARQYAKGVVIGSYYYDFNGMTVKPTFNNDKASKTIKIAIEITAEFARLHTETHKVDSLLHITFKLQNDIKFSTTIDIKNLDNFALILNVNNKTTVDLYVSAGAKNESKKELKYFKEMFLAAKEDGAFDELDNSNASNQKELVLGRVIFTFAGINFNFDISNVFNFEVVGQIGMKAELNINIQAGIQSRGGSISVVKSFDSSAYLDFYLMGKLRVSDTVKIKASANFLGIVNAYIDLQGGPYFEMGGAAMISISSGGGVGSAVGGYIEMGIYVKSTAGVNAQLTYWSLFRGRQTITLYDGSWTLLDTDKKIFKIGDHLMTLYFEDAKEEITIDYFCAQKLSIADFINKNVVMQNLKTMGKETKAANKADCVYVLLEAPSYVTLSADGVLSFKMDSETLFIVVELRYGSIHKKIEITINAQHNSAIYSGYAPTCTEIGYADGKWCAGCGKILEDRTIIPATGHTNGAPVSEKYVAPDCVNTGSYDSVIYCSVCKIELERTAMTIDAEGHTEKIDEYVAPTCTMTGLTEGLRCPKCDHIFIAQQIIPALGHTVVIDAAVAPTCTESGLKEGSHCSVCSVVFVSQAIDYPLGHDYQNDVCSRCGIGETSDKLAYKLSNDGKYYIVTGMGQCTDANLVIPSTYNDLPVKSINASAFKNCAGLKSITLPSTVTSIGDYAFYGCSNVTLISISNGVTSIGNSAFYNCSSLKSITIPDSVTTLGESAFRGCSGLVKMVIGEGVGSIGKSAFYGCTGLEEIYYNAVSVSNFVSDNYVFYNAGKNGNGIQLFIGEKVTKIPDYMCSPYTTSSSSANYAPKITKVVFSENGACTSIGNYVFYSSTSLAEIELTYGIQSIGNNAFYKCTALTNIFIPDSVTSLGMSAFLGCTGMTEAVLSEALTIINEYTFSGCSALVSIDMPDSLTKINYQAFYNCSKLSEIALPSTLNSIANEVFSGCSVIGEIIIPDSVTEIGTKAFYSCSSITSLTIGTGVTKIGEYAFYNCSALENIYFNATAMNNFSNGNNVFSYAGNKSNGIEVLIGENVTTIPSYLFYPNTSGGSYLPNITSLEFEVGSACTKIGNYAFFALSRLNSITIPENIISIGTYAFSNCNSLEEIVFNATNMNNLSSGNCVFTYAGTNTSGIKVTIGKNVTKIPDYLFASRSTSGYNPKITSVVFEDGSVCNIIGAEAFAYCADVIGINIPDCVTAIGDYAFCGCVKLADVSLPDSLTTIGMYAFANCAQITDIVIPDGVTNIRTYAFYKCSGLDSVSLSEYVIQIETYAFSECQSLVSLTIPDSVTTIANNAFSKCTSLESLNIGRGVVSISTYAFYGCIALEEIYFGAVNMNDLNSGNYVFYRAGHEGEGIDLVISSEVTKIPAYLFYPYSYNYAPLIETVEFEAGSVCVSIGKCAFSNIESLTQIVIPDSVTTIGSNAFECCGLTSVTLGSNVSSIGDKVFYCCEELSSINLPAGITSIGSYAFAECLKLDEIVIPNGVTTIGANAFLGCVSLTEIIIPDSVSSIGTNAFKSCSALVDVTIGKGVTGIGANAFYGCYALEKINFNAVAINNFGSQNYVFAYAGQYGDGIDVVIGNEVTKIPAYFLYPYTTVSYLPKIASITFEEGSVCTIIDTYAFYKCASLTEIVIPDSVTTIGTYAFGECSALSSVTLGKSVVSIGASAFYNCYSLNNIALPDGVASIGDYAFYCCESLTSIIIPDSVTTIGNRAFYACSSLVDLAIGEGVDSIGTYAFYGCEKLEKIYFNATEMSNLSSNNYVFAYAGCESSGISVIIGSEVTFIPSYLFSPYSSNYNYIPNIISVEFAEESVCIGIGEYAFYRCTSLATVTIPDSVTNIGSSAFSYCLGLKAISFGNGVTDIGNSMFSGCLDLESVILGEGITSIGMSAFYNCSSLANVVLGNGLISIGDSAFFGCESLTEIVIPDSVTTIGTQIFYGCTSLKDVTLGSSLTSIPNYTFYNCESLIEIVIPDSVTSIGSSAFKYCDSLTSITLPFVGATKSGTSNTHLGYIFGASSYSGNNSYVPETLKAVVITGGSSIGAYAFYNCSNIASITIPESVTTMGNYAFYGCYLLEEIYFNAIAMNDLSSSNQVFYCAGNSGNGIKVIVGSSVTKIPAYLFYFGNTTQSPKITALEFEEGGVCESIGDYAFAYVKTFTNLVIPDGVEKIGDYAFYNCSALEDVTIGDGVVSIGYSAFHSCTDLKSVTIGNCVESIGSSAFYSCTDLESVTIGNCVESIGGYAFYNCYRLTGIVIPDSVAFISSGAFSYCSGLKDVYITDIAAWCNISFGDYNANPLYYADNLYLNGELVTELVIPDSATTIGGYAFYNYKKLESVIIPSSVATIGSYAFSNCDGLTSIVIPDSVTSIGSSAFSNCDGLTSVVIPDSVTSIGSSAFSNCDGLVSVVIPDSVTSIGSSAFYDCTALQSVVIGKSVKSIGYSAFSYTALVSVVIPDSVTSLGESAFYKCESLVSVTLGDGLVAISSGVFSDCTSLASIVIPDNIKTIDKNAFLNCGSLESVAIGKSVKSIGEKAFYGCTSIENLYFNALSMNDFTESNNAFDSLALNGDGVKVIIGKDVAKIPAYLFYSATSTQSPRITDLEFEEGCVCESIGAYAFYGLLALKSVEIGESVTSIGENAFTGCKALEEIYLNAAALNDFGEGDYIFTYAGQSGEGIKLIIGKDVTKIPAYLFYPYSVDSTYMPKIVSVEFEEGSVCASIGSYAFAGCTYITSIVMPDSVTKIGSYAFTGLSNITSVIIPYGVTSIGSNAFYGCSSLSDIVIPESVTWIGASALGGCSSLTSVTLPFVGSAKDGKSITHFGYIFGASSYSDNSSYVPTSLESVVITGGTKIADNAFYRCANLKSVEIADSVTSIGSYAFQDCSDLTNVKLSENITYIPVYMFYNCDSLASVTIPDGVTEIRGNAFNGCSSLAVVVIPSSLTGISSNAFSNCSNLEAVYISDVAAWCNIGFGNVSSNPLSYAKNLYLNGELVTELVIPEGVTRIVSNAFYNCTSITSVKIPSGVTNIGSNAFYGCNNLSDLYIDDIAAWCNISFGYEDANPLYYADNFYLNGELVTDIVIPDGVTAIPKYAFYDIDHITNVVIPDSVTTIGNDAFYNCASLASVTLGNGVTGIGSSAFRGCSSLVSIEIPDSVTTIDSYAFYNCSSLESVTIGNGVTSIGGDAFFGCSSLVSIEIPDSVTTIGSYAFHNCTALESVTLGNGVTSIGGSAFRGCSSLVSIEIPDSVTTIGGYVFYNCSSLESVTMGSSVTSIGERAFYGCSSLVSIEMPDSVTEIGSNAFYGCSSLTSVVIPDSVTSIGDYAFSSCSGLTNIVIPDSVTSIGDGAFDGCSNLTSVVIPDSVTEIGSSAFRNCRSLAEITIGNGVTEMVGYAFSGCSALKKVYITDMTAWCNIYREYASSSPLYNSADLYLNGELVTEIVIPDGVTAIPDYAFAYCSSLTKVVIPDSVTKIGECAFRYCPNLASVIIGDGVTEIGNSAFAYCPNLKDVTIGDSVISIASSAFSGCTNAIEVENGVSYIGKWVVDCDTTVENVVLRDDTVGIAGAAFSGCAKLTSIVLPDSLISIGASAFNLCSNLVSINIPAGVTVISNGTFANCSKLASITIPYGVTSIGTEAFYKCTSLTSIVVPDSVTEIGYSAFYGCSKLTSITLPFVGSNKDGTGSTHFGVIFGASIYQENRTYVPTSLNTVVITGGVIDTYSFYNCWYITNVTIGSAVQRINSYAFNGCSALSSVKFENPNGWYYASSATATSGSAFSSSQLKNTSTAATYLKSGYYTYYWFKN